MTNSNSNENETHDVTPEHEESMGQHESHEHAGHRHRRRGHRRGCCQRRYGRRQWQKCRGRWTPANIVAMVVGFVLFWPLGLFVLFWVMSGRHVRELPGAIREQWVRFRGDRDMPRFTSIHSDNSVFNEYQQAQMDRIREMRDEVRERSRRFEAFREKAQRRADEEEFNRFMADAPVTGDRA
ncbi:MAG: hypothetical protein CSB44_07325 [Gammaproteobacteria bacterium]|nr:MAG: hypothetical protein CSB44_07325 [Gammaproteobacteria bacterium]